MKRNPQYINNPNNLDKMIDNGFVVVRKSDIEQTQYKNNAISQRQAYEYKDVELFIISGLDSGYDLIDILILAREKFSNIEIDRFLYEFREKGLI